MALGDVKSPIRDTFICNEVHLPQETFTKIINERGLNVEIEARNCSLRSAGVALSSGHLLDYAPCQKCDGYCPLCGRLLDDEEYENGHCLKCGWDWESGPFAPPEPECYCWEIALPAIYKKDENYGSIDIHDIRGRERCRR